MRCQCFIRIFVRFGEAGFYVHVITRGKILFDDVLFMVCRAPFLTEKLTSAIMVVMSSRG